MKDRTPVKLDQLKRLEPITSLSDERLEELIPLVYVEQLPIGGNLFREGDLDNQAIYLLSGDIQLSSSDGKINRSMNHKSEDARFPLDDSQPRQASCSALTRVEILRIDNSVLDYMMMWDQLAVSEDQGDYGSTVVEQPKPAKEESKPVAEKKTQQKPEGDDKISQEETRPAETKQVETAPAETQQAEAKQAETEQAEKKPAETKQTESAAKPDKDEIQTPPTGAQETSVVEADEGLEAAGFAGEDRSWIRKMRHIMAFKSMPPANIKRLLERMESIDVKKGDSIIEQGEPGEYYYVLTEGQAEVTRTVRLADLDAGRSFGEEALISESKRNASVSMKTDGIVMRLSKNDFNELLQEPLLNRVSPGEAKVQVANGAVWLDVRHAREYHHNHLPSAMNIPLHEIRMRADELDKSISYICYCSTGKRSAAAAFLLVQKGFNASVLNGGIKVMAQDLVKGS